MEKTIRQVGAYKIHYMQLETHNWVIHREDGPAVIDKHGNETWTWYDRIYMNFYSWLDDADISKELEAELRLKYG